MRLRTPVAVLATLVPLALAVPATAGTQPQTLFVDHNDVACSDTGTGTAAVPFCSIQAAADVALPGQTVLIDPNGHPGPGSDDYPTGLTVSRSGNPGAPITFTSDKRDDIVLSGTQPTPGVTFDNVHDVAFDGFIVDSGGTGAVIEGSSNLGLDSDSFFVPPDTTGADAVDISGASSHVTLTRIAMDAVPTSLSIGAGASDVVVADSVMQFGEQGPNPVVSVTGADGTTFVNDTVVADEIRCPTGIAITGSTNTLLENNVLYGNADCATASPLISVSADSAATTTEDYDDLWSFGGTQHPSPTLYSWAGTDFATPAAFTQATGQGTHDTNVDPHIDSRGVPDSTAVIDSGDPDAPDILPTDVFGQPRVDDPLVPNAFGGIVDRGAFETQDPIAARLAVSAKRAPTGGTVTATVTATSPWGPATSYTVDFGDGTTVTSATPTLTHAYAAPGGYDVTATATDSLGHTSTATAAAFVMVAKPVPTTLALRATPLGGQAVSILPLLTDSWNLVNFTCDWGDGTTPTVVTGTCAHTYSTMGTYTVTVTALDAGGNRTSATVPFTTSGARFVAFGPKRLLDTRNGTGTGGTIAKVPANGTLRLPVAGVAGVPADVQAVALNVTVTAPATGGDVIAYPDGIARPTVSTVNFTAGQTVPNLTIVPVGADGSVDLSVVGGPVDLVADVTGYFVGQSTANGFTSVTSRRLLDTRTTGPIAAHGTLPLTIEGAAGIPASGVTAVAVNMTVTGPAQGGFVTAYPDGTPRPTASTVNFVKGETVANLAIVPVGVDGRIDITNSSPGTTNVLADVVGYFTATGGNTYVPMTPSRFFDTRQGSPVPARSSVAESVRLPSGDTAGVVLNVTVTGPTQGGFVLVGPHPLPDGLSTSASTLNWSSAGRTLANLAIPSSADDEFTVFNGSDGTTNVIGDVSGYFQAGTSQR